MGKTYKDSSQHDKRNARKYGRVPMLFNNKPLRIGRCVSGKIGFPNEVSAQQRADEILSSGDSRGVTAFRVYQCDLCKFYHLTSKI